MSVVSFEGLMGSGKSTLAVALAYDQHVENRTRIVSNMHLNFDYTHLDLEWFIENLLTKEMENCIIIGDEWFQAVDSRNSSSKENRVFSYFIYQARKRNVDFFFCTHNIDHVDKRFQRAVDIRVACRHKQHKPCAKCKCKNCKGKGRIDGRPCPVCNGVGGTGEITGTGDVHGRPCVQCRGYGQWGITTGYFLDKRRRERYELPIESSKYWHLFDTNERIPLQAKLLAGIDTTEVV